jgi:hypothetical protein
MVGREEFLGCDGESPVDAFGNDFYWMPRAIELHR